MYASINRTVIFAVLNTAYVANQVQVEDIEKSIQHRMIDEKTKNKKKT